MKPFRALVAAAMLAVVAACATVENLPINQPTTDPNAGIAPGHDTGLYEDDMLVALAFSGGGTRAAAFSFGALQALAETDIPGRGRRAPLLDQIDFITGVSGGSVTAAYFGLKRRAALADFRERFLLQDAEAALRTNVTLANISRALGGGVNDDTRFRDWLDANLFDGARFSALLTERRPRIWINATDIFNRTPFVFGKTAFSVICSDLADYPVAGAVAASAAVPVVFAPVVIETFPDRCNAKLPDWITRAADNPDASPLLRAFAQGIGRYRSGTMKYIKLLDGGLVDNFGLSGFTVARESSQTPYGPLSREQAVKLRRVLFFVVDAGRAPQAASWTQTLAGPTGTELVMAVTDAALDASVRSSYAAFEATMESWREALVRWRCGLPAREAQRLGGGANWNCRDLRFHIGRIAFDQLPPGRAARLNAVPTRFRLEPEQVDDLIAAGKDAVSRHPTFKAFLSGL